MKKKLSKQKTKKSIEVREKKERKKNLFRRAN